MAAITKSDDVRRVNRQLVLSALRLGGPMSRTAIATGTGLSASTVSAIMSDLMSEGVVIEARPVDEASPRRGRPQVAMGLDAAAAGVVAVVLSLNALSASLLDYADGTIAEESLRLSTLDLPIEDLLAQVSQIVGRAIAAAPAGMRVLRIAMAVQGITDSSSRTLLWSPITPHSDIALADHLERDFGIPTTVENDCNMIALAVRMRRPDWMGEHFAVVLLSHGIGMGLVVHGTLFTGTRSSGGEFGHMSHVPDGARCRCGRHGCIEAYAGNYAIWRRATGADPHTPPAADIDGAEMRALAERARLGDGPERRAFQEAGEAIGFGLGSLFALIDPAPVLFVGMGTHAFDLMEDPLRGAMARTAGGQDARSLLFRTELNELPLIREGCAIRALSHIDCEIFAAGVVPEIARAVA